MSCASMSQSRVTISVSVSSIVTIVAVVLLLLLLRHLQDLIIVLMTSVVLAATITPIVNWAEDHRVPRWLAVIGVYLGLIGSFVGVGVLIGPTLVTQTESLISQIPVYSEILYSRFQEFVAHINNTQPELIPELINPQAITNWAFRSSQQLLLRSLGVTRGIVGAVVESLLVLLISGYMVAGSKPLLHGLTELFPHPWDRRLRAQIKPAAQRMGGFIQGRVLVSLILGVVITIGLGLLGLPQFALALGVFAGSANLIPFVGPVLGAIPALIVALSTGGWTWLWVLLLFLIVQNLEGNILSPLLIGSSVKLHPLYMLLAVIGGTEVLGVLGALVVPPWLAGAAVLLENLYLRPKAIGEARDDHPEPLDDNGKAEPSRLSNSVNEVVGNSD